MRGLWFVWLVGCGTGSFSIGDDTDVVVEPQPACENPIPIVLDGSETGMVRCADGAINRVRAVAVDPIIPDDRCRSGDPKLECSTDADCGAGELGACIRRAQTDGGTPMCVCAITCRNDKDCQNDEACLPTGVFPGGESYPQCVPASCRKPEACESGECGVFAYHDGCEAHAGMACRDADFDECHTDDTCGGSEVCAASGGIGWSCESLDCG